MGDREGKERDKRGVRSFETGVPCALISEHQMEHANSAAGSEVGVSISNSDALISSRSYVACILVLRITRH